MKIYQHGYFYIIPLIAITVLIAMAVYLTPKERYNPGEQNPFTGRVLSIEDEYKTQEPSPTASSEPDLNKGKN